MAEISDERLADLIAGPKYAGTGDDLCSALAELKRRRAEARQAPGNDGAAQWFDLTGDARLGECATNGCGGQPTVRLEAGGIGANYCSGCAAKIRSQQAPLPAGTVTTEMVNAAWGKGKDLHMSGLPTDFRQVLEAAFAARPAEIRYVAVDHTGCIYTCEDEDQAIKIAKDIRDDTLAARPAAEPVGVKGLQRYSAIGSRGPVMVKSETGAWLSYEDVCSALATPPVPDSVVEALRIAQERFDQIDCAGFDTTHRQSTVEVLDYVKSLARDGSKRTRAALASITETGGAK